MVLLRLSALCVAAIAALASLHTCTALNDYAVPAVDYAALASSPSVQAALLHALQTDGIVALRNVPDYAAQRSTYLAKAASCSVVAKENKAEFLLHRRLSDGTQRFTISTESGRKLSESGHETLAHCPGYLEAYQTFSQLVEDVVSGVGRALDATQALRIATGSDVALSARELVDESVHLDHFHAYEAPTERSLTSAVDADSAPLSLEMHTDNGLMIAMTAPEYFDVAASGDVHAKHTRSEDAGLVIETSRGERVRPVLVADELVLMLGSGADQWIRTTPALRPVLHGMRFPRGLSYADAGSGAAAHSILRAWFGKMILLHTDAVMANTGMTYGVYANRTTRYLVESSADEGFAAVACPVNRRLQASDSKCMTKTCTLKAGADASGMIESCQVTCNHESPDDAALCAKNCECSPQSVPGHKCWMLCVADVSAAVCPGEQRCNDAFTMSKLAMTCAAPTVAPGTAAPVSASPSPVSSPSPSSAPTTKTPKPTPTTKKPTPSAASASSSSRAGSGKGTATPAAGTSAGVSSRSAMSDTSIDAPAGGSSAKANAPAPSTARGASVAPDASKNKSSAASSIAFSLALAVASAALALC